MDAQVIVIRWPAVAWQNEPTGLEAAHLAERTQLKSRKGPASNCNSLNQNVFGPNSALFATSVAAC